MPLKRAASIDIGSNTTLFLVGDVDSNGKITVIDEEQVSNGIGKDVFQYGKILSGTIERNLNILRSLTIYAPATGAKEIIIAGTSALRSASNKDQFISAVEKNLGVRVRIIPGVEEARLSYLGYQSGKTAIRGNILLADVGGGSSEFVLGAEGEIQQSFSLNIGGVRLMEDFPLGDPPERDKYRNLLSHIPSYLTLLEEDMLSGRRLVFSGGAATALATLHKGLYSYDGDAIEGRVLDSRRIAQIQEKFLNSTLSERKRLLHFDPDRADVIIGGTAIILTVMKKLNAGQCRITNRGLRFGLLSEWGMGAGNQ